MYRKSQSRGKPEEGGKDYRAGQAKQKERTTPMPIRNPAPNRREDKLHQRKGGHQQAQYFATVKPVGIAGEERLQKFLAVAGQKRQNDAKAQKIDQHDQKDNEQCPAPRSLVGLKYGFLGFLRLTLV